MEDFIITHTKIRLIISQAEIIQPGFFVKSLSPTKENFDQLKYLIENDILDSIKANLHFGNTTQDDANQLKELTRQLYEHIYKHYEELGGYQEMKQLLYGALELPLDKYRIKIDELEAAAQKLEAKNRKAYEEKQKAYEEKQQLESENLRLKKRIQELENK